MLMYTSGEVPEQGESAHDCNNFLNITTKPECLILINVPRSIWVGGAVAYWLVRWTPDRTVRVQASARALRCVLRQDTLHSQCLSSPRCINGYRRIYYWG